MSDDTTVTPESITIRNQRDLDVILYSLFCQVSDITANPDIADVAADLIFRIAGQTLVLPISMVEDIKRRTRISALLHHLTHL